MAMSMRTRLQGLVTWGVLALAYGCGGQVVVDPGSGSGDDISGGYARRNHE